MSDYAAFLAGKRLVAPPCGIPEPPPVNPMLFPFQADVVRWAVKRGRAALWLDCGLGKTPCSLDWSRIVAAHTGGRVLILTPLAVAQQFVTEGEKFGIPVKHVRDGSEVDAPIVVTNYERLHRFDPSAFAGVVLDESSCLKDFSSATRNQLIEAFARTPFRLACSATPAPNDHVELGNHAEFLGVMSRTEMLSMFFVHDGGSTQDWRLKGHARSEFWKWICSWAVALRKPSELGYADDGFVLPPLRIHDHTVQSDHRVAREAGLLFAADAQTLNEQRAARRASLDERIALAARMVNDSADPWVVWCDLNAESEALASAIHDAVEVTGSMDADEKEARIHGFTRGDSRVIVSKASIAGWGVNWQRCHSAAFVGLSHSFESWYQAIRRIYRFGQTMPVDCHVITSSAEGAVVANLKRKQADAEAMAAEMVKHMSVYTDIRATGRTFTAYNPTVPLRFPPWLT